MVSKRPVIGIPADRRLLGKNHQPYHLVGEKYVTAVLDAAGGLPLLVPAIGRELQLEELLETPKRVIDVFEALFARPITAGLLGMATGESRAHLNYLEMTGRAMRESDAHGVLWWRRAR